jgi:outer membrane protein OmpA-like peptidoglycan-associated protein
MKSGKWGPENHKTSIINQGTTMRTLYRATLWAILLILFGGLPQQLTAQTAAQFFEQGRYRQAALAYEEMAKTNPAEFQNAARSYVALKAWDDAIRTYTAYRDQATGANKVEVNAIISILQRPSENLYIENMGAAINGSDNELLPRVTADGSRLYFYARNRPGGLGSGDAWFVDRQSGGGWGIPQNVGTPVNTTSEEGILALSADGQTAIVFGNYGWRSGGGDLFYAQRSGDRWSIPCNMGNIINTPGWESMATLSPDGRTLLFVSYKSRLSGRSSDNATDIYISHLENGTWSTPKPLPAPINNARNQTWPFMNSDGRTLFFVSNGHPGLGGTDIFVSRRIGNGWDNWSEPVNLGKDINSVFDEGEVTIPASGTIGYFTRETIAGDNGYGMDDLFRFVIPAAFRPDPLVAIYGSTVNQDGSTIAATLRWSDFDTGEALGFATSSSEDGSYYLTLPFGRRYLITINQRGYLFQTEMLDLREQTDNIVTFADQLGADAPGIRAALNRLQTAKDQYTLLASSNSTELNRSFAEMDRLLEEIRRAEADLETASRRARLNWLETNAGLIRIRKDVQLTEATTGARIVLRNIYFETGSARLSQESTQELDRLVQIMESSTLVIEIGGHSDNTGSLDLNMRLSRDRAESVRTYLINAGIPALRVTARGYGPEQPIASNDTDEGRRENRRVEVKITEDGPPEGTGDLQHEQQTRTPSAETTNLNLFDLYRLAAIASGVPAGDPCYSTGTVVVVETIDRTRKPGWWKRFISRFQRSPRERTTTTAATTTTTQTGTGSSSGSDTSTRREPREASSGTGWFSRFGSGGSGRTSSSSEDHMHNAMGDYNLSFISHAGGGMFDNGDFSSAGIASTSASDNGELTWFGYFLGESYGGGVQSLRYRNLRRSTRLPLTFDTGFELYGMYNSKTFPLGLAQELKVTGVVLGTTIPLRLRYTRERGNLRYSYHMGYQWNPLGLLDIKNTNEFDDQGNGESVSFYTPSYIEIGMNMRWKFLQAGISSQASGNDSGVYLRIGAAF